MLKKAVLIGIVALGCLALPALAQEPTTGGGAVTSVQLTAAEEQALLSVGRALHNPHLTSDLDFYYGA